MRTGSCGEESSPWTLVWKCSWTWLSSACAAASGRECVGPEDADFPGAGRGLGQSLTVTPSWGQVRAEVSTETSQHLLCPQNLTTGVTAWLLSWMSRSHLARGRLLVGYNSSQLNAIKPHGVFLEKLTSLFLSLALNNPRAWLPCTLGLAQNNTQWAGNAATCFWWLQTLPVHLDINGLIHS